MEREREERGSQMPVVLMALLAALLAFGALRMQYAGILPFSYAFSDIFLFAGLYLWFYWRAGRNKISSYRGYVLPVLFAVFMLLGVSYRNLGSWDQCFGSGLNFIKSAVAFTGYVILFKGILQEVFALLERMNTLKDSKSSLLLWLFGPKCFFHVFSTIFLLWMPFILLSYPGGSCVDVSYQIKEVLGEAPFSTQQPLVHTLLVGGCVKLGYLLLHSYNAGLFFYILLQSLVFAAILAYSVETLRKRKVPNSFLAVGLGIYGLVPIYANFASMAIKDTLFAAFLLLYVVFMAECLWEFEIGGRLSVRAGTGMAVAAALTMLFRNNGIYVILAGTAAFAVFLWKPRRKVCIAAAKRLFNWGILIGPFVIYFLLTIGLSQVLHAENVGSREMLSLPLQQTARYARDYGEEITDEEKRAIEAVLGEYSTLGEVYDPDISDPVKNRFSAKASPQELAAYFKVWALQFAKHPDAYVQAAFQGAYGWFYPGVNNSIRYEGLLPIFYRPALLAGVERRLNGWYEFWDSIPLLGLLQNAGFYTWSLFVFIAFVRKKRKKAELVLCMPACVSLLICIASPAFFLHIRYAFPIMFTMPFLFGTLCINKDEA